MEKMEELLKEIERLKKENEKVERLEKENKKVERLEKENEKLKKRMDVVELEKAVAEVTEQLRDVDLSQTSASVLTVSEATDMARVIHHYESNLAQFNELKRKLAAEVLTEIEQQTLRELTDTLNSGKKKYYKMLSKSKCPSTIATDQFARARFAGTEMRIPASLFCDVFKTYTPPEISAREEVDDSFSRKFQRLLFYSICQKDKVKELKEEAKLNRSIAELLKSAGIPLSRQGAVLSYSTDGVVQFFEESIKDWLFDAFLECKIAVGRGDPRLQGVAYVKYAGDPIVAQGNVWLLPPSLLLAWREFEVDIYGTVVLQPQHRKKKGEVGVACSHLAHFSLTNAEVAKAMVCWLKGMLEKLEQKRLEPARQKFPLIAEYEDDDGRKFPLTFTEHIRDNVFSATATTGSVEEGRIVKFVGRYGKEVHKLCADNNFAPALYSCQFLPEHSVWMLVMAKDDGFRTLKSALDDQTVHKPAAVKENLKNALECIHSNAYVHGDFRSPNILVNNDGEVKIIDFDWSGKEASVYYPVPLNDGIDWPKGAAFDQRIRKEHDCFFLEKHLSQL
ncbi:uncharacterized protein [Oscarella lobularis]|uniref:uncharacterized protein n=1 Tax=Oscarella lobularis TaxID=121494 RepID=UPI003313F23D